MSEVSTILGILTDFVSIIIIGLLVSLFARKIRISNVLLLIVAGYLIGLLSKTYGFLHISTETIITVAIITLILIIFQGSSQFEIKVLDNLSFSTLKVTGLFLVINLIIISIVSSVLLFGNFHLITVLYSLVFAAIISGTDPASIFSMLKSKTNKVVNFLEVEGILNTPLVVLVPFIILDVISQISSQGDISYEIYLSSILTQILVGIGSGILVGLIFFKAMKRFYSDKISALAIICAALLSYILAENLNGNGVLAAAVLGFMFGNIYVSHKDVLQSFSGMLSNSLEILVFILLGYIITPVFESEFILNSLLIFATLILTRYIAIYVGLAASEYSYKEKLFMTLNMPKGIAVAVLVFSLVFHNDPNLTIVANLVVFIMIYSLILSTVVNKFSKFFIRADVEK